MVDLETFIMSLKITWIRRLIHSDCIWTQIFNTTINSDIKSIFHFGTDFTSGLVQKTMNPFWKEVLKSLFELQKKLTPNTLDQILCSRL